MTIPAQAQQTPTSFKIATYNIQSGRGEPGLAGRPVLFTDNMNCTDSRQPLNAWGVNLVQSHLLAALSDPSVVALALQEAWVCGTPANVQQVLGWKARSTSRNGLAMVARHGFAGPEEWLQLDTSLNINPSDTMWILRVPVCLDAACATSIPVYAAHWFAESDRSAPVDVYNAVLRASYDRQAAQAVDFLKRTGTGRAHILIGDLNTWEGTQRVCGQDPLNAGLNRLRDAAYVDAWPLIHGGAEGFTGMTNRSGCGIPEGYVWKRPDYVWSPSHFLPLSIARFGVVPPGDASPSDHYGLLATFPWPPDDGPPNPPPGPPTIPAGAGEIVLHANHASAIAGNWQLVPDNAAAGGARLWNPDARVPKLAAATAPSSYFELSFRAEGGRPYRLWIRGKADGNAWTNDSVSAQFSGSVNEDGAAVFRIGTSSATALSIEEASGAGLSGWGWQDNGYGSLGPLVYFAVTGDQRIRIQQREDGISVDQVVLSPSTYLTVPPGAAKNDTTYYTESAGGPAPPPPPPPSAEIVLYASHATAMAGTWRRETDGTAAGGARLWIPDAGVPKLTAASSAPISYFDLSFNAEAGRPYRLWIRGKAELDRWTNDSVFVQFSGSVDQAGRPIFRIGTTGATSVSVEEGSGMGLSGWGWQDNGYGGDGPLVYFAVTGPQRLRIQQREDGISIDQVVLSSSTYLSRAPGAPKNDSTILR